MNVRDREDAVVARLHALAPHLDGEPTPEFRAATRARLVAMAAVRTPAPAPASRLQRLLAGRALDATPPRWRTRLTAGIAGAALTVTAAAALVAVAADAKPGDLLYDVKRGTEQTQLALAGDSRGTTLLEFASTRLDELESLVDAPSALPAGAATTDGGTTVLAAGADPELVLSTLATMDDQTTAGAEWLADRAVSDRDGAPLTDLGDWAADQAAELAALQPLVPDAAGSAVGDSLALLSDIAARTAGLQTALDCAAGPAVDGSDALGPVPAACVPARTPPASGGTGSSDGSTPPASTQAGTPTDPSTPSTDSGSGGGTSGGVDGGTGGALPTPPSVPGTTTPGGLLPSLPTLPSLPGPRIGGGSSAPSPSSPSLGVDICLPPLPPIGHC